MGQDEILRAVVNRAIQDKRVTNPLQVVNLPHAGGATNRAAPPDTIQALAAWMKKAP